MSARTSSPVLVSESTSTRAIALESVTLKCEPFSPNPFYAWGPDQRTRVMIFALNLTLQPGEDLSVLTADAEDAAHRHYDLKVEYVGSVPSQEWLTAVILRLNDDLTDVGDVLVGLKYNGAASNRVRMAIGHVGGGPADDSGAAPTPAPPYIISGQVTESGKGLSGVLLTLIGTQNGQATSDNSGAYSFTITTFGDYTVTPSKPFYNFTPQSLVFNNLSNSRTGISFNATRQTFTVEGKVTDESSKGLDGVVVALTDVTNGVTATASTSNGGNFSFANVVAGFNYTVTPASNNIFTFTSQNIDALNGNLTLGFNGARRTYNISGQVTDENSKGLDGIVVALTDVTNGVTATASTSNGGNFSFANVAAGFNYTVTPANNNIFTFTSQNIDALNGNLTLGFNGARRTYNISGQVTDDAHMALAGVAVNLSGAQTAMATTDGQGNYSFAGIRAGLNYSIVPSQTNFYQFAPQNISNLGGSETVNFAGTLREHNLSGRVTDGVNGLDSVTLVLSGSQTGTAQTDANGNYSFSVLATGNYTVTPSKTHYLFIPQNQSFNNLGSSQIVNFNGALRKYTITGRVMDSSGQGLVGMTVTLSGSEAAATITERDGSYSLSATALGNYVVTPSIEQDFYTFAPASQQLNSLTGDRTAGFTGTLAPIPDPFTVLEFDGDRKSVDYGYFWPPHVNLGHFFWEFWAMPGTNAGATYLLSDGYGGAHALLFGFGFYGASEPGRYQLFGDTFDGVLDLSHITFFSSDQGPAVGEWGHFAVGWDGQNIITYYDGVPVGKTPFVGPRQSPPFGGGGGRLLIGGSDHNNLVGRIAQVRGYEDSNPREGAPGSGGSAVESSFAPQTVFGVAGNLLSYYFRPAQKVADLSFGYDSIIYDGHTHPGVPRGTSAGILFDCGNCPPPQFVLDPTAPNFATGAPPAPVNVALPAPIPAGARVFDSFGRVNSTYLFGGLGGLGLTEGGAAGQQIWQTSQDSSQRKPFGILNGVAVLLGNSTSLAWVSTGSATANLDVGVDRRARSWGSGISTGLCFRVASDQNYFFAYTSGASSATQTLSVGYRLNGQRTDLATGVSMPSTWTTLSVVTNNSGSIQVYADGSLVYSTNSGVMASASGAGLYNDLPGLALVNRWDNFTVYDAP